jgi:nicotinamidase-related amidase
MKLAKIILECLMVIDVQNTTISKEYEIPEWNIRYQKCRDRVVNIERLVRFFRERHLPVIHILTTEWTQKFLPWNIQKLYDENPDARFYHEGLSESIIKPFNTELVIRKNMPSAFGGTDYIEENYLYNLLVPMRHITICGFYSTGCVHETIIEGFNRHKLFFNIVQDCCETFDAPESQTFQNMLFTRHFNYMNGHVIQLSDILDVDLHDSFAQ